MAEEKDPNYKGDDWMKTRISDLNPVELRVYGELAQVSVNGVCTTPMTPKILWSVCRKRKLQYHTTGYVKPVLSRQSLQYHIQ